MALRLAGWPLQPGALAGVDRHHIHMGPAADEPRALDRLRAQPLQVDEDGQLMRFAASEQGFPVALAKRVTPKDPQAFAPVEALRASPQSQPPERGRWKPKWLTNTLGSLASATRACGSVSSSLLKPMGFCP